MVIGIALVVAVGLLAMCLRVWTEFGQRSRQLQAEVDHNKRLIEEHTEKLESVRAKIEEVKEETESLLKERGGLETDVIQQREQVTQLEQRVERTRPKSHRVDKDDT